MRPKFGEGGSSSSCRCLSRKTKSTPDFGLEFFKEIDYQTLQHISTT